MNYFFGAMAVFVLGWLAMTYRKYRQLKNKELLDKIYKGSADAIHDKTLDQLIDDTNDNPRGHT